MDIPSSWRCFPPRASLSLYRSSRHSLTSCRASRALSSHKGFLFGSNVVESSISLRASLSALSPLPSPPSLSPGVLSIRTPQTGTILLLHRFIVGPPPAPRPLVSLSLSLSLFPHFFIVQHFLTLPLQSLGFF